jgi:hypothetical protein
MYTYNTSKTICELLEISFEENPSLSDQELDKIPEDAKNYSIPPIQHLFGDLNPMKRKEVSARVAKKLTGKKLSEEHRQKISVAHMGKSVPNYPKDRKRTWFWVTDGNVNTRIQKGEDIPAGFTKGVTKTWRTGFSRKQKEVIVCDKCGCSGGAPAMRRWHFDKCKV